MKIQKITITTMIGLAPIFLFAQKSFTLKGKISDPMPSSMVYLSYSTDDVAILDSTMTDKGEFYFKGKLSSPCTAKISIRHVEDHQPLTKLKDALAFLLEPGDLKMAAMDSLSKASITGSKLNEERRVLNESLKVTRRELSRLKSKYTSKADRTGDVAYKSTMDSIAALTTKELKITTEFIEAHPDSYVALLAFASTSLKFGFNPEDAEKGFSKFSPMAKSLPLGITIKNQIESGKNTQVGKMAMNFTQNDTKGKAISLSDFRGKYVLLDFWASWCGPCRAENPNLVKAYNKLKDKKFEIVGVSLDEKSASWLDAIHKDGLPWIQLSDLKGWRNEVAKQYGIFAVPQNFLIDPNGTIIAKNLRGETLYNEVSKFIK